MSSLDAKEAVALRGKVLAQTDSNAMYASGQLLYLRETTLMAQPFDSERLAVTGEAIALGEQVKNRMTAAMAFFSASQNGTLVYADGDRANLGMMWMDQSGKQLSRLGEPGPAASIEISPDGRSAAVGIADRSNGDIWIYELRNGNRRRFTTDPAREIRGIWSPDGRTIVFNSDRKGKLDLYRKASDGMGAEELLYAGNQPKNPASWSPDGRFVLYGSSEAKSGHDIWVLPMEPAEPRKPYTWMQTDFSEMGGRFSPDGRWIAFESNESGRFEIYVAPFPGPGAKQLVSGSGGINARWRRDGNEIFFVGPDQKLRAAAVKQKGGKLEIAAPQTLFGSLLPGDDSTYDVSANGQRFLVAEAPSEAGARQELIVIQNWMAGLKK